MCSNISIIFQKSTQPSSESFFVYCIGTAQVCYSEPSCAGGIIEAPGPTVKDCCVGTNDGQSYADSSGTCVEDQCVGKRMPKMCFPYRYQ